MTAAHQNQTQTQPDMRTELLALRASIDRILERLETPVAKAPEPSQRFMAIPRYAERCGVSESTVRGWIRRGLPTTQQRPTRVIVDRADAWLDGQRPALRLVGSGGCDP